MAGMKKHLEEGEDEDILRVEQDGDVKMQTEPTKTAALSGLG